VQHERSEVMHRRAGAVPGSEVTTVPGLQRTAFALGCARDKVPQTALRLCRQPGRRPISRDRLGGGGTAALAGLGELMLYRQKVSEECRLLIRA